MKKINRKYIKWSLWICLLIPLFIPSALNTDGKSGFLYGLPFRYITIHQQNPNSGWFFDNFFNGNDGLLINPGTFVINLIIAYLIIQFAFNRFHKKDVQKTEQI
ncbi:hypothetical protein KQI49_02665 [Virgibacillus sp. MSJ-26]|uniref:hypothetical protein n=1 Tax=Virgibacillus sp. MSJ-26 TaxID=2841522 RepID=UPI001C0F63AE|nr:hypothetical protein [Virgibacillus sp. MSJ-26]MBU5465729.1 hypothetical protein [Virgibacillus sp. MSJ-26]